VKIKTLKEGLVNGAPLVEGVVDQIALKRKSRMFEGLQTYNPYFGCDHHCYNDGCWAQRKIAHRLGSRVGCKLCYNFKPHFHRERLTRACVPRGPKIFVGAHCDLFGQWVPKETILKILEFCRSIPKEMWFFETKNPGRYYEFLDLFPENTVLSTTIETNRYYPKFMGQAPSPVVRFAEMRGIPGYPKHISIEPIMSFDFPILVGWISQLHPVKVAVGYDSLHNKLPEPTTWETTGLIEELEQFTEVERKFIKRIPAINSSKTQEGKI